MDSVFAPDSLALIPPVQGEDRVDPTVRGWVYPVGAYQLENRSWSLVRVARPDSVRADTLRFAVVRVRCGPGEPGKNLSVFLQTTDLAIEMESHDFAARHANDIDFQQEQIESWRTDSVRTHWFVVQPGGKLAPALVSHPCVTGCAWHISPLKPYRDSLLALFRQADSASVAAQAVLARRYAEDERENMAQARAMQAKDAAERAASARRIADARAAVEDERRRKIAASGWSASMQAQVIAGELDLGMTFDQVLLAWGAPYETVRTLDKTKGTATWRYHRGSAWRDVRFENGKVIFIQAIDH